MGYTGGTKADPDYHHLGDHTESFQVDFDPARVSYEELLDVFWAAHSPTRRGFSTQYKAAVFYSDEGQRLAAERSRDRLQAELGRAILTEILPLETFYRAEDYHQKYHLRSDRMLMHEFEAMFADVRSFVDSTAAARANAFVSGCAYTGDAEVVVGALGLSDEAAAHLLARLRRRSVIGCGP